MAVTITSVTLVGGTPPTQVRIAGTFTSCEKLDFWVSCDQAKPGKPLVSATVPNPFSIPIDLPVSCGCGDTIYVWVDCYQSSRLPSSAAATLPITFDCDCCPQVNIAVPTVSYPAGGVPIATFQLSAPVAWNPPGCIPPVNITSYQWTVTQGATSYQLGTQAATARTDTGSWTLVPSGNPAIVPLPLAAGSWEVKVRPIFSQGSLSANCDPSDSTIFSVTSPPSCCPYDQHQAPNGASVAVVATGTAPNVTATFTATVYWPGNCPPVAPANYLWQVTDPSGQDIYTRTTPANVAYSNDPGANWKLNGAQIGALPFNTGGTYSVVCTVVFPANSAAAACSTFGQASFSVPGMQPPPQASCCPSVSLSAVIAGTTATFSATTTWPAGCTSAAPTSFAWTVTDSSTNTTFVKNTPASTTDQTGFTPPLTLTPGDSYSLSVTPTYAGATLPQGCNPTGLSTFQAPGSTPPSSGSGSGSPSVSCIVLLVLSIILMIVGGIVFAVGYCIDIFWVWVVGLALCAVGLVLFIIWAILCASKTPCSVLLTMECILDWIVKTGWIVAIIAGFIGGLPCGLASFAVWAGWSILDNYLRTIMFRVGCPPMDCTKPRSG
jgi:hypothetical protein